MTTSLGDPFLDFEHPAGSQPYRIPGTGRLQGVTKGHEAGRFLIREDDGESVGHQGTRHRHGSGP